MEESEVMSFSALDPVLALEFGESDNGGDGLFLVVKGDDEGGVVDGGDDREETGVSCEADFLIFSLSFSSFGLTNVGVDGPEDAEECVGGDGKGCD